MIGNTKKKGSKGPATVAGTGGFAATLKILEQADQDSSPGRCVGAKLSPLPDLRYGDIKQSGTGTSPASSSNFSKITNWDKNNSQLTTR